MTEICDTNQVHAITNVETTLAPIPDLNTPSTIHIALQEKDLLPGEHFLDAGYLDAATLVSAKQDFDIAICKPIRDKQNDGFDLPHFLIDWDHQSVTCPTGQTSQQWSERHSQNRKPAVQVRFSPNICQPRKMYACKKWGSYHYFLTEGATHRTSTSSTGTEHT